MWHQLAPSLDRGQRVHGNVNGRFVTALRLPNGTLRCIDSTCYHAGGPLGIGDIEEVNGESCLKCPWHAYAVSLVDGGKFYESLELDKATKKLLPAGWRKKERAQRVHDIEERKGGGIWVRLNSSPEKYDSDEYAGSAVCAERVQAGDLSGQRRGRDGVMPTQSSGQVFSDQRWRPCKVIKVEKEGSDGIRISIQAGTAFRPKPYPMLMMNSIELFAHEYVVVRIGSIERHYTPLIANAHEADDLLTLSIRVYPKGAVSGSLSRLRVGDTIELRKASETDPPASDLRRLAAAEFLPQKFKRAVLLSAGSGVTPLLAVCRSILENTPDTVVTFLMFDRTPETVLCRDVVSAMVSKYGKRLIVVRVFSHKVDTKPTAGEAYILSQNKLRADVIKKFVFPKLQSGEEKILVSWCGPAKFNEHVPQCLHEAGFSEDKESIFVPFVG